MMIRILASDLDGTLLNEEDRIALTRYPALPKNYIGGADIIFNAEDVYVRKTSDFGITIRVLQNVCSILLADLINI